ncbi:1-phosphatidylinositol-3-phosphate 5-kinase [Metschnikowia aff. pulcherrima]|uniref:1-phosphatidylinositol-3-phosphate 5-kinase n=1 Tax=Metschnikowia aff. pulcherrima TaxID=2163413 RepID=A0A4P6XFS9_9ASCO|nr:1-phosphatidylinositol-3-phosphate 5-kinase [Metschnikowia aff. pulcherrima]
MSSSARNVSYQGYPLSPNPLAAESSSLQKLDDFVSFPTLPDPEVVANRSLSTIISKTLRKVTNNASNLVHNYTSPPVGVAPREEDILDTLLLYSHDGLRSSAAEVPIHDVALGNRGKSPTMPSLPPADPALGPLGPKPPIPVAKKDFEHSSAPSSSHAPDSLPLVTAPPIVTQKDGNLEPRKRPPVPEAPQTTDNVPRVTSDNLFLKLTSSNALKKPMALLSTSDVTAAANSTPESITSARSLAQSSSRLPLIEPGPLTLPKTRTESALKSSAVRMLQNRILSIFNNLPNDIEVSDEDSASDQDTENHETLTNSLVNADGAGMAFMNLLKQKPALRVRISEALTATRKLSPKKLRSPSRKTSGHFSAAILDGAKSIIHTNLAGVGSSSSSMVGSVGAKKSKKKKQRPHKLLNNPLKNGGIPKKYWMNDSFVSDCLNCFKQFTAFRRKHHCRFCGQIFCADCTLFISYSQYKQQRHGKHGGKVTKAYKDNLRVCKPCYSDVVVYLSDDSLSSEEEIIGLSEARSLSGLPVEAGSDKASARLRSYSASSMHSSAILESPLLNSKHLPVFSSRDSPSLNSAPSPFAENTQRSPEGILQRHPPKMAIPTRRTGEAVEIAIPSGSYTQSSSLNIHQNLRSAHALSSMNAVGSELLEAKSWFKSYPRRSASVSSELGNLKSLENISSFYKSVVNGKYARLPTTAKLEFSKRAHNILAQNQDSEAEPEEEEAESENEDEKVMSLYTSLNRLAASSSIPTRPLNHLSTSMPGVPTLLEFPGIEGKYGPANLGQSSAMTRFEFKPIDTFNNSSLTENKQRSNYRSNERAKASMRRIKDRRNQRLVRKIQNGISMIPSVEARNLVHANTTPDQLNSSTLTTQAIDKSFPLGDESPSRRTPIQSIMPARELKSNTTCFSSRSDDRKSFTQSPRDSLDDRIHLITDLTKLQVLDSVDAPEPSVQATLGSMFDEKLRQMIVQCLEDCDIKGDNEQRRWVETLLKTFASIHRVKITDTLDVKQYIKIKKILGGKIEDTSVLEGLFITKDIDSKRMQSLIQNPKIALLVFPLEYLKQKEQFISLRVVNSQQSVYISNLVSRLISLEPDIVVVGDTVCGLAEKLLEEANITVISNVKPQVIERISRYTKGDIFQSVNDLFFKKGSLGACGRFEVKRFVFGDFVKTFSFFVGSQVELGFTICLRGGDEEYLSSVKYASESLVPAAFNFRFERSLFQDFSLVIGSNRRVQDGLDPASLEELMQVDTQDKLDLKAVCVSSMEALGVLNYVKLFAERILSFSPAISYPLPVTLSDVIRSFSKFVHYYELDKSVQRMSELDEIKSEWLSDLQFDFNLERFSGKPDVMLFLKFVSTEWMHFFQREFNFRLRIWSNSMKYSVYQLYPIFHRNIHFLHSRVSIKHATPCYGPMVVVVDFYSDNDKCLGTFLDQTLQETSRSCDECGDLLLNHYKTYVHGNYKIDLIVESVDDVHGQEQFKDKGDRIMWSYCPECNVSSPVSSMSDDTYFLSLGKFFELNFWSRDTWHEKHCEHDFFRSQVKYFGINGFFIRFEISGITTYEVVVPRKKLEFVASTNLELKLESLKTIQESSSKFFQSIMNRLNRIKVDTFDKAEAGHEKIEELKERVKSDQAFISSKTLKIYESTLPTNYMSLNVIQRDIQELGVVWDREFNDFEKRFLPTENEITKITQFHLRNFLMDRLDSEMKDNADNIRVMTQKEEASHMRDSPIQELPRSPLDDPSDQKSTSEDLLSIGSRRIPLTLIEDKIMQIRQSFEEDQNKHILRSPAKPKPDLEIDFSLHEVIGQQAPKRVQDLTNYFNQMTVEFQKQREAVLERQSSKYKAIPIVSSQPIVEIYDNIEDVVDDDNRLKTTSRASLALEKSHESSTSGSKNQSDLRELRTVADDVHCGTLTDNREHEEGGKDPTKSKVEIPQPEKNSLLKSLSNFWADRSATLWDSLEYPLDFTEHTFADSEVIVREDEPSSLVAFCLSTNDYKLKIAGMGSDESVNTEDKSSETMEFSEQFQKKSDHFAKLERKFKKRNDQAKSEESDLEIALNKTKSNHLKYQFVDGSTEMSCKVFYSEQFDALRKACGVDDSYIQSLSRCVKWNSTGGKSGSNFLKTLDNRYVVKELSKSELESFVSIAPFYFKYISQSTFNTLTTALAKIFGFYQVEFKNSMNGKTFKMDLLIMENLFYNRKTTRIFDLKGSMRNRHVKQTGKENEVLLDENMVEYIYESPVFVKEQLKKLLRGSLFNDTSFLSAMDVMDYSLVIGIDDPSGKLYVGIIDWLRTFTWDKKVENWVKGKSLVGKKGKDPTIVTPKQYRTRFREAMDRYILEVPDIWYEGSN